MSYAASRRGLSESVNAKGISSKSGSRTAYRVFSDWANR